MQLYRERNETSGTKFLTRPGFGFCRERERIRALTEKLARFGWKRMWIAGVVVGIRARNWRLIFAKKRWIVVGRSGSRASKNGGTPEWGETEGTEGNRETVEYRGNGYAFNEKPCGCIACTFPCTRIILQVYSSGGSEENSTRSRFNSQYRGRAAFRLAN